MTIIITITYLFPIIFHVILIISITVTKLVIYFSCFSSPLFPSPLLFPFPLILRNLQNEKYSSFLIRFLNDFNLLVLLIFKLYTLS